MKLKEIHRTSTFAWSVSGALPSLATGTVAGALDESFSNESQLEIWTPDYLDKNEFDLGLDGAAGGSVKDSARFNRLAWGSAGGVREHGVLAAGMENGELALWDPARILAGAGVDSLILRNSTHTGPIRGLDFNPIQRSLLASGGVAGEVYIWDLKDPSKPYTPTPGARSAKLDDITSVAWNQQVQYVLAGASGTGYTVVWDLRGKREVVALAYGGQTAGQGQRRGMSDIAWHPDNASFSLLPLATRLVTASEDDTSPIIMVWDLRNARAPEKILTGHEKGVLSLSWCKQDADLLLSCGKDNRALCWNPQTSEIIGELPSNTGYGDTSSNNWAFQVDWCPRNPDMLATAFFDGTIGIHSIQTINDAAEAGQSTATTSVANGADLFDAPVPGSRGGSFTLKQPPKWLRRPVAATFGFGGTLISLQNSSGHPHGEVHLRKIVTDPKVVERARKLQKAMECDSLEDIAQKGEEAVWKALQSLFSANSRDELVNLLGFSKDDVARRVAEAVDRLKTSVSRKKMTVSELNVSEEAVSPEEEATPSMHPDELETEFTRPVVSFAEPEFDSEPVAGLGLDQGDGDGEGSDKTTSEVSVGVVSNPRSVTSNPSILSKDVDAESTTTAPSLFGEDAGPDFFANLGTFNTALVPQVPHTNYALDSSVAATVGSGPSSVASESLRNANTFHIYPLASQSLTDADTGADQLIAKALVLGDFESAVQLCLGAHRWADAILLAVRGGPELLQRTQKVYFDHQLGANAVASAPYLRLFKSIVSNDLADIVQNADLKEWREIFVVLCTFATPDEFANLAEQLGRRLEFESAEEGETSDVLELRRQATLTYLVAARLERLVGIWAEELVEEEHDLVAKGEAHYSAHAHALQSFIEKVTVFRAATKYVDEAIAAEPTADVKTFKLVALYEKYLEYATFLTTQGLIKEAVVFVNLTPMDYKGAGERDILIAATSLTETSKASVASNSYAGQKVANTNSHARKPSAVARYPGVSTAYPGVTASLYQPHASAGPSSYAPAVPQQSAYMSSAPQQGSIARPPVPAQSVYAPPASTQSAYAPPAPAQPAYAPLPHSELIYPPPASSGSHPPPKAGVPSQPGPYPRFVNQQPQTTTSMAPPPRPISGAAVRTPPSRREDNGGWNDAPTSVSRTTNSTPSGNKPAAITTPFPNATPAYSPVPGLSPHGPSSAGSFPPPPRPGSVPQAQHLPPPSRVGAGVYPAPAQQVAPPMSSPTHPVMAVSPSNGLSAPPPPGQSPYPPPRSGAMMPPPPGPGPISSPPRGLGPGSAMASPPPQFSRPGVVAPARANPPGQGPLRRATPSAGPYDNIAQQSGPYTPPPPGPNASQGHALPPAGPPSNAPRPVSVKSKGPTPPEYPPGDRSHIPESARPIFEFLSSELVRTRQMSPPQQRRIVEDLERRINPLFDALNCATLSPPVVEQLLVLTRAMEARDRPAALAIHVDLLTRGSQTDDIALWMSGIKQLIMRL
ncbi:hypothetical protein FISHEDRAFT_55132 [Fistulina hepatica ATCC 64428]|uniref:Protein transport protein SEC31 n=1 Tax=Fistulina hepatica ATCC 64428 TaxID=1128425 RepID=A0A0D7ARQ0_9AGAR|nr:hypothetical protein FISHEDRAFT_55132 [Fistulina hepatica ATCC 64428]